MGGEEEEEEEEAVPACGAFVAAEVEAEEEVRGEVWAAEEAAGSEPTPAAASALALGPEAVEERASKGSDGPAADADDEAESISTESGGRRGGVAK